VNWPLAAGLFAAGVPVGAGLNRLADEVACRRPDARMRARLRGRAAGVLVATPLLLGGCALAFGLHPRVAVAVGFCAALVAVAAIDVEQRIIPNRIVLPGTVVALAVQTAIDPSVEWTAAAFAAAGFFLVAALAYPAGMGMGDVKLALMLGAMLGRGVAVAIAVALLAAGVPSIAILVRHGSRGRKMGIPFAPFLAAGGAVALFAGRSVLHAYLHGLG
jgi:leader peptidase (prepilin peptidase) / N-methyltransferase